MLSITATGEMDLEQAARMMGSLIRGYGMEASDSAHVADVLKKTSSDLKVSISALGELLQKVASWGTRISFDDAVMSIGFDIMYRQAYPYTIK